MNTPSLVQNHSRNFRDMKYVYPVVSRRSGGLSIGVNLSPTARCNFACVYCQVLGDLDVRLQERKCDANLSPLVDLPRLEAELIELIGMATDGRLFEDDWFSRTPPEKRLLRDIAFSGDGEPTLSSQFAETVNRVAAIRKRFCPPSTKLVVITNGTALHVPNVRSALKVLLENNGEIWAKLDAGTPEYYRTISRSTVPYEKIPVNLLDFSREFPIVVQSCFLTLHGVGPTDEEVRSYAGRLKTILDSGGKILRAQIYTVARNTPEPWALPLSDERLDTISETVRKTTGLQVDSFYSS